MGIGDMEGMARSRHVVHGYDELRVRLDPREAGSYRVLATTHSAEVSACFRLPFNQLEVENFVLRISRPGGTHRGGRAALDAARRFGESLFRALFRDQVSDLYHDALAEARRQRRGLRITLCLSEAPELIDIPWEYLFDDPDFLAMSAFTPIVRYLDLPRPQRPVLVQLPLKMLAVVSSPSEYDRLDVERERRDLERATADMRATGVMELHWLERPTPAALLRMLQGDTFHVLHYVGHGEFDRSTGAGVLLFEDDAGWSRPVGGDTLGMILHDFSSLRLAVLNACDGAKNGVADPFSGVAGALVRHGVPAVVAMQSEITDEGAIGFASGFYDALAAGRPVDASLGAARLAMLAERGDDIEWGTPALFMRGADGRLFDLVRGSRMAAHGQRTTPGSMRNPNSVTNARRTVWNPANPSSSWSGWLASSLISSS
jgi:hypothetical protein